MIALKRLDVFKVRGVPFGLATKGEAVAVAGTRLYFKGPSGIRTYPKARCVSSWEEGVLGSDGETVIVYNYRGEFVDSFQLPKHSKVKASPDGLLLCTKEGCSLYWWAGHEEWSVRLEMPGFPAWHSGFWYVPVKGERVVVVKDGEVLNSVEGEGVHTLKECSRALMGVGPWGISFYSLNDPVRPEKVFYMASPEMLFDASPSPDCSMVAFGEMRGLRVVSSDEAFYKPYPEAVTAVAWDSKLVVASGEYLEATVEEFEVLRLEEEVEEAEGAKAIYAFDGRLFVVTENCVLGEEPVCPGGISSLYYHEGLVVAGEKVYAFGEEYELGMIVSVATDGRGFLACDPFSCSYYSKGRELWRLEAKNPKTAYFAGAFVIADEESIRVVTDGEVIKEIRAPLGIPRSVSVDKYLVLLYDRATLVLDKDFEPVWVLGKGGKQVSTWNELVAVVGNRLEIYALGNPHPLDLGEGESLALLNDRAFILKNGRIIKVKIPEMEVKPFPKVADVFSVGSEVKGIARGSCLAVASPSGGFLWDGKDLRKVVPSASDVSSWKDTFVFVDEKEETATVVGRHFKAVVELAFGISKWVAASEEGFLSCGDAGCIFHDWNGESKWSFPKGASGKPVAFKRGFVVLTPFGISYVEDGKEVLEVPTEAVPLSVSRCGDLLIVGTEEGVIILNDRFEVIGELEGLNFVVGVGCSDAGPVIGEERGRVVVGREAFLVEGLGSLLVDGDVYVGTKGGLAFRVPLS